MIKNDYYKDLLVEAINKDELLDFLEGRGRYYIDCNVADVPTNFDTVICTIFYLYEKNKEISIDKKFENEIIRMLNGNEIDIYCSVFLFTNYLYYDNLSKASFHLQVEKISLLIKDTLNKNKEKLKKYLKWTGQNKNNGVWDEMIRLNKTLKSHYNIEIL